ncbi:TIGR01777 family oxidoreductase [Marinifilum sp. RC60d5]|uniref:TIGR01777 family oxidoreductase n=1 Tax=Marinifilum sp. RC60d5 TaxID=3458414 RepID=UPI0040358B05
MKIAISGSKGLIGSNLSNYLAAKLNADILAIPRAMLYGKTKDLAEFLKGTDAIIHLSGSPVVSVWTKKRMNILRESRIVTTKNLCQAVSEMHVKPSLFISTSAVGIYDAKNTHSEENCLYANDFLGKLCQDWEHEANKMNRLNIRTVIFRFGVVLSDEGGVLKKMIPSFRLGLGAILGNGTQMFPFVHIYDVKEAFLHIFSNKTSKGVYNLVAPDIQTNSDFTKILGKCLKRPVLFHVPAILLKIVLKQGATVLLKGQKVIPQRLLDDGFMFKYDTLVKSVKSYFP